jgi:hypothetical protein
MESDFAQNKVQSEVVSIWSSQVKNENDLDTKARLSRMSDEIEETRDSISWATGVARLTLATSLSTFLFLTTRALNNYYKYADPVIQAAAAIMLVVDITLNSLCTALLSGLVGPRLQTPLAKIEALGIKARSRDERAICEKLTAALKDGAHDRSNEASVLASMMGNKDADAIFDEAAKRFRAVDWSVLEQNLDVFRGGTLDGQKASDDLLGLSFKCNIGEVDAFFSHSWHDDVELKIQELTNWCEDFRATNRRSPTLWLDKLCINQSDIASDLECLPVFLAGCNNLLVISGHTYTSRLWCIVELFVYVNMQGFNQGEQAGITVIPLGADDRAKEEIWNTWRNFDCNKCNCFNQSDKDHIMTIIDNFGQGAKGFNERVGKLAKQVLDGELDLNSSLKRVDTLKTKGKTREKKAETEKKQEAAALIIQRHFRAWSRRRYFPARRIQQRHLGLEDQAASARQRRFRFMQPFRFRFMSESASFIQRNFRMQQKKKPAKPGAPAALPASLPPAPTVPPAPTALPPPLPGGSTSE